MLQNKIITAEQGMKQLSQILVPNNTQQNLPVSNQVNILNRPKRQQPIVNTLLGNTSKEPNNILNQIPQNPNVFVANHKMPNLTKGQQTQLINAKNYTTANLNMPGATLSQTLKTLNDTKSLINKWKTYKNASNENPYFNYLSNDLATSANKFLKPNSKITVEPNTYSQLKNIGLKEGVVGNNFTYAKNISMANDALQQYE